MRNVFIISNPHRDVQSGFVLIAYYCKKSKWSSCVLFLLLSQLLQ